MIDVLDWVARFHAGYPELRLDLLGNLMIAVVLGGAIGFERGQAQKPAGVRTNVLICVGAALITDLSVRISSIGPGAADPARLSAQIVSGIGFLGAGAIIQSRGTVTGLTTAATMWVVAAIGMTIGAGARMEAVGTTVLVLMILIPLRAFEARFTPKFGRRMSDAEPQGGEGPVPGDVAKSPGGDPPKDEPVS
jgi:putative Mg2+ transporter-C (MgtC) family protein